MSRRRLFKRNRYKFKKYVFKLTYLQSDRLERCAKLKGITTNRLIKLALNQYLDRYQGMLDDELLVAENQLTLFRKEDFGEQLSIFDEIEKYKD